MDELKDILNSLKREEFLSEGIKQEDIREDPFTMFEEWLKEAMAKDLKLPNAMHLATSGQDNRPSGRIVLLRGYDKGGFVFFTNYESRKSKELQLNNFAALTFFWNELSRQVRIEGKVKRVSSFESDEYFSSRPRKSQISCIASEQSRVLLSRQVLENRVRELEMELKDKKITRPENWGGYRLYPESFEFWQGREHRLHDRILYSRQDENKWKFELLYP